MARLVALMDSIRPHGAPRDADAGHRRQQEHEQDGEGEHPVDAVHETARVADILRHQEMEAIGKRFVSCPQQHSIGGGIRLGRVGVELAPPFPALLQHRGPLAKIAGNDGIGRVGEQIKAVKSPICEALLDRRDQTAVAGAFIRPVQAAALRRDGAVCLTQDVGGGRPVNVSKQCDDHRAEHGDADQREFERRRP